MAQHKRNHYLAQAYLRGFADRKHEDAIWQYRKSTNEIRLKGIRNVAQRPYYYSVEDSAGRLDHTLEQRFGSVESSWPSLRHAVESNLQAVNLKNVPCRITRDVRHSILQYMLIHWLRVPKQMKLMRDYIDKNHPRRDQLADSDKQRLRMDGLAQTHNDMVEQWVSLLASRDLSIEFSPAGSGVTVFTCDNPVIVFNPHGLDGIAYTTSHVLFPISRRSYVRFAGTEIGTMHDRAVVKVHHDRDIIDGFNRAVVERATDEVYASNPHQLYQLLVTMGRKMKLVCPTIGRDFTR